MPASQKAPLLGKFLLDHALWSGWSQIFKNGSLSSFLQQGGSTFLCLQTIFKQQITPAIHKDNPFIQELRFVIRLTDLARWFMPHLQINDMKRGLQNVLPISQRHVPDPMSDKFALIPHPLDQMVGCLQSDVACFLASRTLKDVGVMPRDRFEELQDIDQQLRQRNQVLLPRRITTFHPPGRNGPYPLVPINL